MWGIIPAMLVFLAVTASYTKTASAQILARKFLMRGESTTTADNGKLGLEAMFWDFTMRNLGSGSFYNIPAEGGLLYSIDDFAWGKIG